MKKRITIHTGNISIGGQEKMMVEFLKILSPKKYDINLFIEEDKGEENYYQKDIPEYVNYKFLTSKKFMDSLLEQKKSRKIIDKIKYSFNLKKKKNIAIKEFSKEIENSDLIIDYNLGLLRNIHKLNLKKAPIIGWSHLGNGERQKRKQKENNMLRYNSVVTINTEMEKGFIENYGKKGLTVLRIDNFIDEDIVMKKAEENYNENIGRFILSIGALTQRKNYSELIKAYNLYLQSSESDINLVIIGEGEERGNLESLIKTLKLEERVFLLGRKTNPYPYIKGSELFILPSKGEGFPVVLMEAMTLGKMTVAKNNGGNSEVLKDGKYGVLLNNLEEELSDVLDNVFNKNDYRKGYENLSNERAKDFSKDKARKTIEKLINDFRNID